MAEVAWIALDSISFETQVYPRVRPDYKTINNYALAIKAGAQFPPVVVAHVKGKTILVDGRHRIGAARVCGLKEIQAENLGTLSLRDAFVQAVDRNIRNGLALRAADRKMVRDVLLAFKLSQTKVAQMLQMPIEELREWEAESVKKHEGGTVERTKAVAPKRPAQQFGPGSNQIERIGLDEQIGCIEVLVDSLRFGFVDWGVLTVADKYRALYRLLAEKLPK